MNATRNARRCAGLTLAALFATGTANAASEALKYYPTSVVPSLPSIEEVRAMRAAAPRGILAALRSAYRRSVAQGWVGGASLGGRSVAETTPALAHETPERAAASAAPVGEARAASSAPAEAGAAP
jgi:hypothetical protein